MPKKTDKPPRPINGRGAAGRKAPTKAERGAAASQEAYQRVAAEAERAHAAPPAEKPSAGKPSPAGDTRPARTRHLGGREERQRWAVRTRAGAWIGSVLAPDEGTARRPAAHEYGREPDEIEIRSSAAIYRK